MIGKVYIVYWHGLSFNRSIVKDLTNYYEYLKSVCAVLEKNTACHYWCSKCVKKNHTNLVQSIFSVLWRCIPTVNGHILLTKIHIRE